MPDFCENHSDLVQKVGEIAGKQDAMLDMQQEIKDNIRELFDTVNANRTETAIQKTKYAPILWVLTVIGSLLIGSVWTKGFFG